MLNRNYVALLNSSLRVMLNPFLVFSAYFFLDNSLFGEFSLAFSKALVLSFILEQGLTFFILSQSDFKNKLSRANFILFYLFFASQSLWFFSVHELLLGTAIGASSVFASILRRSGRSIYELISHSICLITSTWLISSGDYGLEMNTLVLYLASVRLIYLVIFIRLKSALQQPFCNKKINIKGHFNSIYPFWGQSIISSMFSNMDTIILSFIVPIETVGVYKLVTTLIGLSIFPLEIINNHFLPKISSSIEMSMSCKVVVADYMKKNKMLVKLFFILSLAVLLSKNLISDAFSSLNLQFPYVEFDKLSIFFFIIIPFFVFYFCRSSSYVYANLLSLFGYQRQRVASLLVLNIIYLLAVTIVVYIHGVNSVIIVLAIHSSIQLLVYRSLANRYCSNII